MHTYGSANYRSSYIEFRRGLLGVKVNNPWDGNLLDINKGKGGDFVYLEPVYTTNPKDAANEIHLEITGSSRSGKVDLAKGAGGKYRYLYITNRGNTCSKITHVTLWEGRLSAVPEGWDGKTIDLNKGRGGRDIAVVWKIEPSGLC